MIRETRTAAASGWFMFWQQQTNVIFTLLQRRQPHAVMASLRRSHLPHPKEKECRRHDIVLKLTAKCFINNNQDGTAIIGGSASVVGTPLTLSMLHTNNGAENDERSNKSSEGLQIH